MAQHAISAIHYAGGKMDLVALHKVVEKEFGSTELALAAAERVSVLECANLIASGDEVCIVRRTESHAWEIVCDVKILRDGKDITGVDIVDRPNDALQDLPVWD